MKSFEKVNKGLCAHFSDSVFNQFFYLRKEVFGLFGESPDEFWDLNVNLLWEKIGTIENEQLKNALMIRFRSIVNLGKLRSAESSRYFEHAQVK